MGGVWNKHSTQASRPAGSTWRPSIDDGGSLERLLESSSGSTWRLSTDDGGSLERPLERPLERSLYLLIYTLLSLFLLVSVRLKKGYYRP